MIPTMSEVIFWCVLGVLALSFWIWSANKNDRDEYASDYWIDRNIHGKK